MESKCNYLCLVLTNASLLEKDKVVRNANVKAIH